jgi:O-antigen/teichoic acid export membrane protein
MALANLPMNNAISLMLAKEHFGRLLFVRFISNIVFLIYAAINFFYLKYSVETTIVVQICSQLLTSIVCIALGWDGLIRIIFVTRESVIKLLNFGKYSMGTLISTSLLKSADTFILGLVPILGIDSVALYSIPLKLSELLEIPLRSFAATLYPRMAKASNCAKRTVLSALYHDYTGMLFYFFLPILIFCELFAYPLVLIFGGEQYLAAVPIFRLYILYGLFLPFDRITGVGLDAVGAPKYNLLKVVVMAAINIGGDLAALLVFKSLYAMAIVTIVNTFVGAYIGYVVLNRYIPIRFSQIFVRGWKFILAKKATIYEHLTK